MYSKLLLNRKKIMFILAIGAGVLLCSQSVHAVSSSDATSMTSGVCVSDIYQGVDISSNNPNNVINWSSFNIGEGETVQYDQNNYLNLIHDSKASEIYGNIEGGNNVYLINPNGFLFGDNSSINVGNLYISTRALEDVNVSDFVTNGINPLSIPATNLVGDIVNLGKIRANQVVLEGNNVTLKNAIDIMNQSDDARNNTVTIKAVNSIEIGNADNVDNIWIHNIDITDFKLIYNFNDLKNMKAGMNYMLANDIDAARYGEWDGVCDSDSNPIKFNGLNHKISNLLIGYENSEKRKSHIGIFGDLHGVVKNVSVVNSKFYGVEDVGSLVGYMYKDAVVDNCHSIGCEVHGTEFVGGLVGTANGGTITNSTNSSKVYGWSYVGGIVGITDTNDFTLKNCQNSGDVQCYFDEGYANGTPYYGDKNRYYNSFTGGLIGCAHYSFFGTDCIIENSSNSGYVKGTTNVGGLVGIYGGKSSITGCINKGTVKGSENIGGLVGNYVPETEDSAIKNCINLGNVIVTGDSPLTAGELVGVYVSGKISDNYSEGIVKYGATYDNDSEEGLATTNELVGDTYFDKDEIRQLNQKPSTQTDSGIQINSDNHTGRGITIKPGIKIEPLSPTKPSEKPIIPADLSDKQNAINDGLKEADCLKSLFSNDFQNFSKGTTLVGETIQATKDDEETVSSRKKLILKE